MRALRGKDGEGSEVGLWVKHIVRRCVFDRVVLGRLGGKLVKRLEGGVRMVHK